MKTLRNFIRESLLLEVEFARTGALPGRPTTYTKATTPIKDKLLDGGKRLWNLGSTYRRSGKSRSSILGRAIDSVARYRKTWIGIIIGVAGAAILGKKSTDIMEEKDKPTVEISENNMATYDDEVCKILETDAATISLSMRDSKIETTTRGSPEEFTRNRQELKTYYDALTQKIVSVDDYADFSTGGMYEYYKSTTGKIDALIEKTASDIKQQAKTVSDEKLLKDELRHHAFNRILLSLTEDVFHRALAEDVEEIVKYESSEKQAELKKSLDSDMSDAYTTLENNQKYKEAVEYFKE